MKRLSLLLSGLTVLLFAHAQSSLRIKLGASRPVPSAGSEQYIYKIETGATLLPVLGAELARPLGKGRSNWMAGVTWDVQQVHPVVNRKSFQSLTEERLLGSSMWALRFYGGVERQLRPVSDPSANHFTLVAGLGLNYNYEDGSLSYTHPGSAGVTKNNEVFQSPHQSSPFFSGPATTIYTRRVNVLSPLLFAGSRWHLNNRKGRATMIAELIGTFGLLTNMRYTVPFVLDGSTRSESFDDKGHSVQLNLLFPLVRFRKTK